ncbi:ligand-binding sensor domain-containing diguanylate cyclase [Marinagarivorans cellulosilyticus]|nr:ligand-binding sensor domain-containing diguanylate cyclase [Marinagarivorans cellulosilyticus]
MAKTAQPPLRFDHQVFDHGADVRRLGGINRVIQDHQGFMWFAGSSAGLGRYDGSVLKLYQHDPNDITSVPDNFVWDIAINSQGHLWVATGRGICEYKRESDSFYCPQSFAGSKAVIRGASALLFDDQDRLYVGTHTTPYRIDFNNNTLQEFDLSTRNGEMLLNNTVWDIEIGPNGNIWFAISRLGIVRLSPSAKHAEIIQTSCKKKAAQQTTFYTLAFDHSNHLWAGTNGGGLCWIDPTNNAHEKVFWPNTLLGGSHNAVVRDLHVNNKGEVWASVGHQGILVFDQNKQLLAHHTHSSGRPSSIQSNQTRSVFEDKNNDMWIGLFPFGVDFIDRSREHIRTYKNNAMDPKSLSNNAILTVFEDSKNSIWVGTEFGLNRLNNDGTFKRFIAEPGNPHRLQANAILSIAEDQNGFLWVGTWSGGLYHFDPDSETFKHYGPQANNPNSLGDSFAWGAFIDSKNRLWVGSEGAGLQQYRKDSDDFVHYKNNNGQDNAISNLYVLHITEDKKGDLWLATYYGLNHFDPETKTFTSWQGDKDDPTKLSSSIIKSLLYSTDNYLWVGTHDNGLNRFDPNTGAVLRIGLDEGLPSSTVSSLLEDNAGNIWVATSNGLARIHPETFKINIYSEGVGLAGINYNRNATLAARDGTLYFGSTEGLTAMAPNALTLKESWHPIHITEFRVSNKIINIGKDSILKESTLTSDNITLEHSHGMFSLDFSVLSYRFPGNYEYAYQLEGFDKNWLYIGHRNTAIYTNLNPGTYSFKVKARVPGEQWQQRARTLTLVITPPWWRTYWAYCLYTLLFLGFIYGIYCIGRLKRTSDNYRHLAATDPLTGIYNRSGILLVVEALRQNKNNDKTQTQATLIIDIDHFKKINDTYGHAVGDQAIQHVVDTLQKNIRKEDYLGRWGGEEFIILVQLASKVALQQFGDDLCHAVENTPMQLDNATPLQLTVSIGGALHHTNEPFDSTCQRADEALYVAKESGRNRFCGAND